MLVAASDLNIVILLICLEIDVLPNGTVKDFVSPITTKPWGKFIPKLAEGEKPNQGDINSQTLYSEPEGLNTNKELPKVEKSAFKKGVYY